MALTDAGMLDMPILPVEGEILTISQLNNLSRQLLEKSLGTVWVQGEVSNLARPSSGHAYFSLKDGKAQIRCALFRGRMVDPNLWLANGVEVVVQAKVTLYEERGDYQLIVQTIQMAGTGYLLKQLEMLKQRLRDEGVLTRPKKPLPAWPTAIGVVTSPTGAAVRDVLSVLKRRYPMATVYLYPCLVQGMQSAPFIVQALEHAALHAAVDVLLLVRGGGSLEDLWGFNEEMVVRSLLKMPMPVVTGVGHETDRTLVDDVADLRAPTPSAAAELISPDQALEFQKVSLTSRRLLRSFEQAWERKQQHLDRLRIGLRDPQAQLQEKQRKIIHDKTRMLHAITSMMARLSMRFAQITHRLHMPERLFPINAKKMHLERMQFRLHATLEKQMRARELALARLRARLMGLSPFATLDRGFSMVTNQHGVPITSVQPLAVGDSVMVRMKDGILKTLITEKIIRHGEGT